MENPTINDRIVELIKFLELSPTAFADEIGIQRSGVIPYYERTEQAFARCGAEDRYPFPGYQPDMAGKRYRKHILLYSQCNKPAAETGPSDA